jgi:four helix bundle protein
METSDASAWQTTHQLALDVYRATAHFPAAEREGLAEQMRRAAALLPIAMGQVRQQPQRRQHSYLLLLMDQTIRELQYYVTLAQDLDYLAPHLSQVIQHDLDDVLWHLSSETRLVPAERAVEHATRPIAAHGRAPALAEHL